MNRIDFDEGVRLARAEGFDAWAKDGHPDRPSALVIASRAGVVAQGEITDAAGMFGFDAVVRVRGAAFRVQDEVVHLGWRAFLREAVNVVVEALRVRDAALRLAGRP